MDDSVIKVLRRNGSWENSKAKNENNSISSPTKNDGQVLEDDFKLDEKFQILAQEIKKRMYNREAIKKKSVNSHKGGHSKKSFRNTMVKEFTLMIVFVFLRKITYKI